MSNLETITNKILAKRAKLNAEKKEQENAEIAQISEAVAKIKKLAPKMKKLMKIATTMQENGFQLGTIMGNDPCPAFITNWWSHRIGFYPAEHPTDIRGSNFYPLKGFGIMNGGACGSVDLVIDQNGNIKSPGQTHDLIIFANHFDDFMESFLAYVEKVTG